MVHPTAAHSIEGHRLRVGMVGGGRNAFIGSVHRMAMRLDDLIELKAGALSACTTLMAPISPAAPISRTG
jgi:hypothetical protein